MCETLVVVVVGERGNRGVVYIPAGKHHIGEKKKVCGIIMKEVGREEKKRGESSVTNNNNLRVMLG